jgi:hypothetical protein
VKMDRTRRPKMSNSAVQRPSASTLHPEPPIIQMDEHALDGSKSS